VLAVALFSRACVGADGWRGRVIDCDGMHHLWPFLQHSGLPPIPPPPIVSTLRPCLPLSTHNSTLLTHARLFDPRQLVHVGATDEAVLGSHSLVVVGWRWVAPSPSATEDATAAGSEGEPDSEVRLLVQNWWQDKQFFEVDLEYLASRGAHVTWVMGEVKHLPEPFPLVNAVAAQSKVRGNDTGLREVPGGQLAGCEAPPPFKLRG
jgi:hypothetical protein